jgi:CRISPR-associated protein Csb1
MPDAPRLLIEAVLRPVQGSRFQPTGFPDLGAATYTLPDGTEMLLVESAQSMANRLEATCWDEATGALPRPLAGMPYVEVKRDGAALTNSLLEAHRLNSVYVENSDGFEAIKGAIGFDPKQPVDRLRFARALLKLDPNSLIHGTFLESIGGALRVPRALSGFVEARDVRVVASGGVKNDRVAAGKDAEANATAKEGYGNVPFHRDEYSAAEITAFFNLDLGQLRAYQLGQAATHFMYLLSLWKIQTLLKSGLRLRTACDLDVVEIKVTRPQGFALPGLDALDTELPQVIKALRGEGLLGDSPLAVTYPAGPAKKAARKGSEKAE